VLREAGIEREAPVQSRPAPTYDILDAALRELEEHPELAARLRAVLGIERAPEPTPEQYMKVKQYADYARYSKSSIENFIKEGMPLAGKGTRRRVCVAEADQWLRQNRGRPEDDAASGATTDVGERARQDARLSSSKTRGKAKRP